MPNPREILDQHRPPALVFEALKALGLPEDLTRIVGKPFGFYMGNADSPLFSSVIQNFYVTRDSDGAYKNVKVVVNEGLLVPTGLGPVTRLDGVVELGSASWSCVYEDADFALGWLQIGGLS